MFQNKKELTKKQKLILYISAAAASVAAAVGATFLLILLVKNPPDFVFYNDSPTFSSRFSTLSTSPDYVYVPNATTIIAPEQTHTEIEEILQSASQAKPEKSNKIVVKNYKIDSSNLIKRKTKINIDFLSQNPELPTGCEITSLATVLNFYGYEIDKTTLSKQYLTKTENKIGDFWEAFVGDPTGNGFGCYAKPIVDAANRYLNSNDKMYTAVDYSGTKFEKLLKLVESDTPVIIWGTTYNEELKTLTEPYSSVKWTVNDKELTWIAPEHCMVLIGYDLDKNIALVSDPLRGIVEYDLDTVKARYLALHSQCVVLEKNTYVTGIDNNATYYTTQCVAVTENENIKSVTLNGRETDNVFLINGNVEETYKIVITYFDDTTIEYVVYTKPVYSLLDQLNGINERNATEDHVEKIQSVKNVAASLNTQYSKYSETKAAEDVVAVCDLMLDKVKIANEELDKVKEKINNIETNAVNSNITEEITKLTAQLDYLMSLSNYTYAQNLEIINLREKCNNWLATLLPLE